MFTSSSPKDENLYVLNGTETIENLAISTADDVNYFKFEILEDGSADDYIAITSEAERWDLDLEFLDADGNVVVYSRMAENTGRVSLNGLKAGEYFIKVTGDNDTVKNCTLDYHFTNSALIASDVYEGMEDRNGAVDIRQSQKISGLSIASSSKEDETRADTFKITMEYDGWKSSRIILTDYRSDWEGLNYVLSTDAAGTDVIASGIGSEISLAGLKAGDYYLTVDTPVENQYSEYSVIARDIPDSSSEPENTWSIFVYLAGDNNLEGAYLTDLLGMQKAILPENVEVYVLMDGSANCSTAERDWSDTRVGRIRHSNGSAVAVEWMYFEGIDTDTYVSTSTLDRMQEWDTGSISTLEAFLDWGMQTGSADNYALIMKGHGTSLGWNSADETSNSMMSITEIADLLKQDKYNDLSVVAFDQCLMGSDVVISGMENAVEYVVASEAVSYAPSQLMMYEDLFNNLETDMTARELAEKMVASSNHSGSFDLTWAAFDTSDTYLSTALNKFASHAADFTYADWTALCTAFGTAVNYGDEVCAFSDLISVLEETLKFTVSTVLEDALTELISDVRNYVIKAAQVTPTAYGNGLSVFNPVLSSARMNQYYYAGGGKLDYYTSGIGQMAWGDFLYTVGKLAGDIAGDEWGKDPGDALEASDIDDSYVAQAVVPVPSINIEADTETVTNKLAVTATIPEYAESYYSSDLITWTKFEGTLYLEQNGLYYFKAVGETGVESNYVSLNVENIDNIAPSLQISGNPAEWSKSAVLTAVTDDETATIEFYDGTQWIAGNEFTVTANGTYKFRVTDAAGNVTEQSVIVDKLSNVLSRIVVSSGTTRDLGDRVLFSGNTASQGGGAIENRGEVILGMNAEFTGNSATYGGAIYNIGSGSVTIGAGATFSDNSAGSYGGAIANYNQGELVLGMNAEFTGNSASNMGGAIYNFNGNITIEDNATFSDNTATGGSGGAIFNDNGTVTIKSNAVFSDNTASNLGGAIANYKQGELVLGMNAEFTGNTARTGGAIYNNVQGDGIASITLGDGANFSGNSAQSQGGAIFNNVQGDGIASITLGAGANFSGNSSQSQGGTIYNVLGTVTLGDAATFSDNTASGFGGAVYNAGTFSIGNNVTFIKNSVDRGSGGGALSNGTGSVTTIGDGAHFFDNTTSGSGGAIENRGEVILGMNAEFTDNSAVNNGGAIYNAGTASITLGDGAIFSGNTASQGGGAIYNESGATVTLGDAVFATASDTVCNYGTIIVNGNVSFAAVVTLGGESSLQNNGNIDLNIANRTADDDALISDWSRISGEGSFSVTVSADQTFGTYQLANGSSGFAGSITVGDGTVDYGSVSVDGEVLTFNNVDYLLAFADGDLYLKVGDFTPPTLEISGNVDSWTNQDIILSATVSDGVVEYFNGENWVAGDNLTVTENGTYQFRVTDAAGNVTTKDFVVENIDKVAPTLEITADKTALTNTDVVLTATVSDGTVEYFNGENWVTGDKLTVSANGTYQFRVTDAAGNVTEKSIKVGNIDKVAPTLEISGNADNWTNQDITLSATVSDGVVEYFNGENWVAGDTLTVTENGEYQFRATDLVGNVTTQTVIVDKIDKVAAPIPTGFTGAVAGYDAKLDWDDASDIGVSGVKGYYIRYGTSETLTGEGEFITASEFDLTGLAVGTYYYQVKTMDNAGNISEWSAAQSFEIIPGEVQNLQGDCNGLSWDAIPGVKGYIVEYSTDNFAHVISFETTSNKVDSFALPAGIYQWRVKVIGGNAVSNGENIISQQIIVGPQEIVSNANSMKDVFFANASGIWDQNYVAQHLGILNSWNGTRETAALIGKNNLADIFEGSEDANILVMTDDANGDTLFVDDIYTALPGTVAEQQARIAQIDEIRAGMGDDIVDMTSQRVAYIGDGVRIYGGLGNDTVWANNGNNTLFGDAGNDRLVGGADNDVLVGGADNDRMHGGGGEDIFCFGENWGNDTVEQLVDGEVTLWFGAGSESNWNADTLTYTDGANSVKVSGVSSDNITLIFGDDNSLRYDELVNSGCFDDAVSEKIFEDKDKGMLA